MLENPPQRIEGDSAHSTIMYNTTRRVSSPEEEQRQRQRRVITKGSNAFEGDNELSRVVTITVRDEYLDWILERSYVPDVAVVPEHRDEYVDWLFKKLLRVDVTRSVRSILNEDAASIPDEVVSWIRKGFKCRRFKPKSSGSRNRCHGIRFFIRLIRPEEGVGKATKYYVITPLNIEWSGCAHCTRVTSQRVKSYLESRTFYKKVRSISRKTSFLVEKMSCLDQRASEGRGNVHDAQTLRPIKGRVLLNYVEDYVRNSNITEDPEYAVKLGGASFSERYQSGPMGAFDVIKRARKQQLGQSLARDKNFKKVLNSSSTPTSIGEEWWLSNVRKDGTMRERLNQSEYLWKNDVVRRLGATMRTRRSLNRVWKRTEEKNTTIKLTEWIHPVVQRPHKVFWRLLLFVLGCVLTLKFLAQLRAVRVCDGWFDFDPLILPTPLDERFYPSYEDSTCVIVDPRSYEEQVCPSNNEVVLDDSDDDESWGQVFRKAMNTDQPNDLNLDGHAASTAFLKYIWSDMLLFFLILFHLSMVQSEGLWNSIDSKGWKWIREQVNKSKSQESDTRSLTRCCWRVVRLICSIISHKLYTFYKDTVLQLLESIQNSHLKPGEDFFGPTILTQLAIFFVVLFTQANITTTLEENYIEGTYVIKIVGVLVVAYLDRISYVRRNILLKFTLHVVCLVMYTVWWNYELQNLSTSQQILTGLCLLYLFLSSLQVCYGYPAISPFGIISGPNFFADYYNKKFEIYGWVYRIFYYMPLLPEVAGILDWACTSTTLLIGEWVRVQDIYSTIYLSEVSFEFYIRMKRDKGEPQKTWRKWVQGGLLSLLLFAVLIFPLLVFSDLNPSNENSELIEVAIEIGFPEYEFLYTHNADVSLDYLPSRGSSATCPYSTEVVSSIGSESSRNWYDETFCFTSSTFDYNCLATSDTNVYNYFPSLDSSSISAVFATSTQFVYFPVSQSARTWGISPPDKHRLLLQLNSSEEIMTMDVYLNFKRSFYYDDNQDSRIRTSVTLSEDQKRGLFTLLSSSENRTSSSVTLRNLVPSMVYLANDASVSFPDGLSQDSGYWNDCELTYLTSYDMYLQQLEDVRDSVCSAVNASCSFTVVTAWGETRIYENGMCDETLSCDDANGTKFQTELEELVQTSETLFKFQEYWDFSCHLSKDSDIWFGRPKHENITNPQQLSDCFTNSCTTSSETRCFDNETVGPSLFVVSAPYVLLLQYLSSSSIIGLYIVFVFAVSRVVREVMREGRFDFIYQYMPFARRLGNLVEQMDQCRMMAMMSNDKTNRRDFLQLEEEIFSELVNKYRRPEELYKTTGKFQHWFKAEASEIEAQHKADLRRQERDRAEYAMRKLRGIKEKFE